jgi:hypothetical protein
MVGDAEGYTLTHSINAAYLLDLVHHIDRVAARMLLATLMDALEPGGRLIVKDVDTKPAYKRWFTLVLDKAMDWRTRVDYWNQTEMMAALGSESVQVFRHSMIDYLPYPHVIYVANKPLVVGESSAHMPLRRTRAASLAVAALQ